MTEGDDNVDLTDPFALQRPSESDGDRSRVDIDLTEDSSSYSGSSTGSSSDPSSGYSTPAHDGAVLYPETPQVQVIVVAEHAGTKLSEVLLSLGDQSYDEIEVTVLNATGDDTLPSRMMGKHPFAVWVEMSRDQGFASLANWALDNVDESTSPFILIMRDDTALAPGAVSYLVEEMFRSNAGIVGPKLVDWNDPSKLLAVGYGADRRGRRVELIESDEFDQDQYSSVSDVFVIPSGAQMIRTDLFKHLGGFDPVMDGQNEDLDLCWRAHTVAARVIVVPQATARISRPIPSKALALRQHSERAKHRLRTLAVTSSRWGFPRAIIGAVLALVLGAIGNLLRLRPGYAKASLAAIPWNLRRIGGMRTRRKALRAIRQVGDSEIHALQSSFGPTVGSLVGQSVRPSARLAEWTRSIRKSLMDERQRVGSSVAAFLGLALLMILLGTWNLFGEMPVVAGSNPILPGGRELLEQWWSGYRNTGLGTETASPLSFLVLGLLGIVFAWSPETLHALLLVGPLVLGALGVFNLVRPLGGPRGAAIATAVAVANPLTAEAFAAARWETLVLWALAPFLLTSAARLGDLEPWNAKPRPLPSRLIRFGAVVAIGAAFAPAALVLGVLAAVAVALFGCATGRLHRVGHGALGVGAALLVPAALDLRFTREVLIEGRWDWLVGEVSAEESIGGFSELLQFAPGRSNGSVLMWGLVAAASLGLLFGRKTRFDAAVLGWLTAVVGFVSAWASTTELASINLPGADVLLTLAAAGLALAVGASVRSVQVDLKRYGYGWRQFATVIAAAGAVAVLLLGFGKSLDGRHTHPEVGYAEITSLLDGQEGQSRVLWLGDPRVVPADVSATPATGVEFAITNGGTTTVADRFLPTTPELNAEVGALLEFAVSGDTVRLGRLLAPFGIDYVIYQPQLAPAPYVGPSFAVDAGLAGSLDDQLDLRRQAGTLNLLVFRNEAASGTALVLDDGFDTSISTVVELLDTNLSTDRSLTPVEHSTTSIQFAADSSLEAGSRILIAQPVNGWSPTGGAGSIEATVGRLAVLTIDDPSVPFGLQYTPPSSWWAWLVLQSLLIMGALVAASRVSATDTTTPPEAEVTVDLRSSRQIARDLDRSDEFAREPVGDSL